MQIDINLSKCEGHGLCEQLAPQVFGLDDEGYVFLKVDQPIPAELEEAAAAGARVCPVAALRVLR
ncbi:ferredoxin [Humibacter ginsenosidimutans]|uniref:Ferredoxin n=2 Tax=Humibacter ginsenosidimutans TaxID=2599293 RepID=A0A5B8M962_9MICO|nr:ferredoxin [Humibacter ginsenosidimutans]